MGLTIKPNSGRIAHPQFGPYNSSWPKFVAINFTPNIREEFPEIAEALRVYIGDGEFPIEFDVMSNLDETNLPILLSPIDDIISSRWFIGYFKQK